MNQVLESSKVRAVEEYIKYDSMVVSFESDEYYISISLEKIRISNLF